jgi:hypothetical protein
MTTQGAAGPLPATNKMDAERACLLHGNVRIIAISTDNEILTGIRNGDRVAYKYLDFGEGVHSITMRLAPAENEGTVHIALDDPWGPVQATIQVPGKGDGNTWNEYTVNTTEIRGKHALWLRFETMGENSFQLDWFRFDTLVSDPKQEIHENSKVN